MDFIGFVRRNTDVRARAVSTKHGPRSRAVAQPTVRWEFFRFDGAAFEFEI